MSMELATENKLPEKGCASIGNKDGNPAVLSSLVPYKEHTTAPQLSWEADSTWSLRMMQVLIEGARLKMLMAWCSTLGGAHSSLGEHSLSHAEVAGVISGRQLCLAVGLKDPLLATRCKLYLAYSLLQQGKLKQAARIIRMQYKYITKDAAVLDQKLVTMCLAAWERTNQLRQHMKAEQKIPSGQKPTILVEHAGTPKQLMTFALPHFHIKLSE